MIDFQKEKINNYRSLWIISIYTFLGIIAYSFNFIEKLSIYKQILLLIGAIINLVAMFYFTYKVKMETDKLKEIE